MKQPMSSYAVQMREYERRLLRAALDEVGGDLQGAADLLGIEYLHMKARCTYLGGITDTTKHEPPEHQFKVVTQLVKKSAARAEARAERKKVARAAAASAVDEAQTTMLVVAESSHSDEPHLFEDDVATEGSGDA